MIGPSLHLTGEEHSAGGRAIWSGNEIFFISLR